MPQPKLYKSKKARKLANQAKSKRHHESRNKASINAKRRERYREQRESTEKAKIRKTGLAGNHSDKEPGSALAEDQHTRHARLWLERATRVHNRFLAYIQDNAVQFMHRACRDYLQLKTSSSILEREKVLGEYHLSLTRIHNSIYESLGIVKEHQAVGDMVNQVKEVIGWLEEVACLILCDYNEVRSAYHKAALEFQKRR
ncbi:hypothetical protein CVT24_007355 [Panaeolus cyanescens]|uniref:Uncharacterized protein n=1 Tax=Panaeolus cyanescens TaxID=181874 RepID=A0A409YWF2_9AGAR|nr:hypothetical protein CVT24_007355 [Panaeolus cyanescens]